MSTLNGLFAMLLLAGNATLAWIVYSVPDSAASFVVPSGVIQDAPPVSLFEGGATDAPIELHRVIADRSLFHPGRQAVDRPIALAQPTEAAVQAPKAPPLPPISATTTLFGIVGEPGNRIALIRSNSSADMIRVREGSLIDGWQVVRIEPDRMQFEAAGRTEELKLYDAGPQWQAAHPGTAIGFQGVHRHPTSEIGQSMDFPNSNPPMPRPAAQTGMN